MPIPEKYLAILKANIKNIRIPDENSIVEKDECGFSFDTQYSPNGLYTNISTWQSYGYDYVKLDYEKTNQQIYLHQKFYKRVMNDKPSNSDEKIEVVKLGIGIEGGFEIDENKIKIEKKNSIVIIPDFYIIEINDNDIPIIISECIKKIINHIGIKAKDEVKSWTDELKETICHNNLLQVEVNIKNKPSPNPKDWKCMFCGAKENLWFNLSDGYIGCGRKQLNTDIKSCGASLQHYKDTGNKYHLVVKLGTITANGADIFSYYEKENDMVINPLLSKHLSYWGIDIMKLQKTDQTMQELNIQYNKNFDWNLIMEKGKTLKLICEKELIGLENLGNSCYMNSILQVLFAIDQVKDKYYKHAEQLFKNIPQNIVASNDLITQLAKLSIGLLSDRYLKQQQIIDEENRQWLKIHSNHNNNNNNNNNIKVALKPRMFKKLGGHVEFSTTKQQDAAEYFRYLLEYIHRQEYANKQRINNEILDLKELFKITFEEKLQCQETKQVKYSQSQDTILTLLINLEDINNDQNIIQEQKQGQQQHKNFKPGDKRKWNEIDQDDINNNDNNDNDIKEPQQKKQKLEADKKK